MARHRGRSLGLVEDLSAARKQRRDSEAGVRAAIAGLIVRVILGVTDWLPSHYRWPVAIAVAMLVFVGLGMLDTRYLMTRRHGRHEKPDHRG